MTSDLGVVSSLRQQPLVMLVRIKLCVVNQDYQTCLAPAQPNQDLQHIIKEYYSKYFHYNEKLRKTTPESFLGVYNSRD